MRESKLKMKLHLQQELGGNERLTYLFRLDKLHMCPLQGVEQRSTWTNKTTVLYGLIFVRYDCTEHAGSACLYSAESFLINSLGDLCFFAETQMRRMSPLSCLYCKYEVTTNSCLA